MQALDFNALQQPEWPVTLKDDAKTTVRLTVPTVELIDKFTAMAPELAAAVKAKDGRTVKTAYSIVADLMNCNTDFLTFTPEELRDIYNMSLLDLLVFTKGYLDFISEIKNAKN